MARGRDEQAISNFLGGLSAAAQGRESSHEAAMALHRQNQAELLRIARMDPATRNWRPDTLTGTAVALQNAELWQARMRDLQANNDTVVRVEQILADFVVGGGIASFTDPFAELDLSELMQMSQDRLLRWIDIAYRSDRRFDDWASSLESSASRRTCFYEQQAIALTDCANQGDGFLLRCTHGRPMSHGVMRCWQSFEKEQLDCTLDRERYSTKSRTYNEIVNGIEIDSHGRPVAYHLLQSHPGDHQSGTLWESQRVPAERIIHLMAFHRPAMHIGITWWSAMAQPALDRQKFLGSELATAIKCSLFALFAAMDDEDRHGLTGDPEEGDADYPDGRGRNDDVYLGTSPKAIVTGEKGKFEVVESNRPNPNAESFYRLIDHAAASAAGQSYFRAFGRYGETNYSGIKAAMGDDEIHFRKISKWLVNRLVNPVRLDWQREAGPLGVLGISQLEYNRHAHRLERYDHIGPGRELLEPGKEQEAITGSLRACLSHLKRECAKRGMHWLTVLREHHVANRVAEALGVQIDWTKGNGGNAADASQTSEAEAAEA